MVTDYESAISRKTILPAAALVLLALAVSSSPLLAQGRVFWQPGGVPVRERTPAGEFAVVSDQKGGLVVWGDDRHPDENALYVQRLDSSGTLMWPDTGIRAVVQPITEAYMVAAGDDRGGVVLCWIDLLGPRWGRICAPRISRDGTKLWGDSGLTVVERGAGARLEYPSICSDGRCGAIVGWYYQDDDTAHLVVQRVDSLGRLMWGPQGVELGRNPKVWWGQLVCLEDSGTCAVWLTQQDDIRAQRIAGNGAAMWQPGGVSVCDEPHRQWVPSAYAVTDGVVVSWADTRNEEDTDIFAQKLSYDGSTLWAENGVPVCAIPGNQGGVNWRYQDMLRSVGHSCGDVTFTWYDRREGRTRMFCQRLNGAGEPMWDTAGVEVGSVATNDTMVDIYEFGLTGADANNIIVSWPRYLGLRAWELRAQKLDSTGRLCWGEGLVIRRDSVVPRICVVTDGTAGAIGCWSDLRFGWPRHSVYAQRYGDVPSSVTGSETETPCGMLSVYPNPACGCPTIRFVVPADKPASLAVYDICGREVRTLWKGTNLAVQPTYIRWDRTADGGRIVPAGVYFVRLAAGSITLDKKLVVLP